VAWASLAGVVAELTISEVIDGVTLVRPAAHRDSRGCFFETYRRSWFPGGREMVQANRSDRVAGTVVGLHYHLRQADYWTASRGVVRVVLHDLRRGSPTEGSTEILEISEADSVGVYIPPGVAHGFAARTDVTLCYLVDRYYDPADELGVAWDDPSVGAVWGVDKPLLSERDLANPPRVALPEHLVPRYRP